MESPYVDCYEAGGLFDALPAPRSGLKSALRDRDAAGMQEDPDPAQQPRQNPLLAMEDPGR